MTENFNARKRIRKSFQRIENIAEMPNLIEVQRLSYDLFLQQNISHEERLNKGLENVFKGVFPIHDYSESSTIEYISYSFVRWKYVLN